MTGIEMIIAGFAGLNVAGTTAVWFRLGQLENLKDRVTRLEQVVFSKG